MNNRDRFHTVRRILNGLKRRGRTVKHRLDFGAYLRFPLGKKMFVLGTPGHTNIGDSAIVVAELEFLKKHLPGKRAVKELSVNEHKQYRESVENAVSDGCAVCWHGGGNMGNQWPDEENFRRDVLAKLPDSPLLIFPQTLYYTPTEEGKREAAASVACYNGRKHLTLVAREQLSYAEMRRLYPDTEILLTPDIVLSSTMETCGAKPQTREGVLLCLRSDPERSMSDGDRTRVERYLAEEGHVIRRTDMYADCVVTRKNRKACVRKKMEEFASSRLVVTDRLHGMIFAALTGTPCVVFSNNNYKIRGTYEWIRYLPYIRYVESGDEAVEAIPELLAIGECRYDNTPLLPHFDQLAQRIGKL